MNPIHRANDAKTIIDSPLWAEMKKDIESTLAGLRRSVPITATDMHTRIILMDQLWGRLQDYFEQIAQTGKLEQLRLAEDEAKKRGVLERLAIWQKGGRNAL